MKPEFTKKGPITKGPEHYSLFLALLVFLTAGFTPLRASSQYEGLQEKVSLQLGATNAAELVRELDRQTSYSFSYSQAQLASVPVARINLKGATLGQALQQLEKSYPLSFSVLDKTISVKPDARPAPAPAAAPAPKRQQQGPGRISGRVLDERGDALPGATLRVPGTQLATATAIDGSFNLTLPPGTYTVEVSFISYQTRQITGIVVKENQNTPLEVPLKPSDNKLSEVVVTGTYERATADGLLLKQKNSAAVTNGISAEQITRSPDRNVGQALKRISGISTFDNKYVVVRGISERYNVATLDGTPLPSTETAQRSFAFDLIPTELIDNVTVSKTITPDMPVGFGGGLVQIQTKDIPDSKFLSFSAGTGFNDQTTGKEFISSKRGKYDFLGIEDGSRDFPEGLINAIVKDIDDNPGETQDKHRFIFTKDNILLYKNKAPVNQNYALSFGNTYTPSGEGRLGVIGSLSYRNSSQTSPVVNQRGTFRHGDTKYPGATFFGAGKEYAYNVTWGGLLNVAYKQGGQQISLRNMYTRIFNGSLVHLFGFSNDLPPDKVAPGLIPYTQRYSYDAKYLGLLQNKLAGEHQVGPLKLEWDIARTNMNRDQPDAIRRENYLTRVGDRYWYKDVYSDEPRMFPFSRHDFEVSETDYNWNISAETPIVKDGPFAGVLKVGYGGFDKILDYMHQSALLGADEKNFPDELNYLPLEDLYKPKNFRQGMFYYELRAPRGYKGKSKLQAGYLMLDQRLFTNLRVVGGLRVEYFDMDMGKNIYEDVAIGHVKIILPNNLDKEWQVLPSANLTYSLTPKINLRTSYSQSMVRPDFNEKSNKEEYDPTLNAVIFGSGNITSTKFTNYDFRAEWYPGLGEVLSAGVFYKNLERPLEMVRRTSTLYAFMNSKWGKNYGLELDARKRLDFIGPENSFLHNITLSGNLTLIKSKVKSVFLRHVAVDSTHKNYIPGVVVEEEIEVEDTERERSLYGQTPILANAGIQYEGQLLGFNLLYNHIGKRFFVVTDSYASDEYETPLDRFDAQLSLNLLKKRGQLRFNVTNIFNSYNYAYENAASYEFKGNGPAYSNNLKPGYTEDLDVGDQITYSKRPGRSFSLSFSYSIR